jgi:hypothetical protein
MIWRRRCRARAKPQPLFDVGKPLSGRPGEFSRNLLAMGPRNHSLFSVLPKGHNQWKKLKSVRRSVVSFSRDG